MPTQEDIDNQQQLLDTHRRTLVHYLRQRAQFGTAHEPPSVAHGIAEARAEIRRVKAILAGWGVAVADGPDETEPATGPKTGTAAPLTPVVREPVPDFVGRAAEIAQVRRVFSRVTDHGAIAAISGVRGMGGVGKTELACAVAQSLADLFPDGQMLVELRGASAPLPPALALQTVLTMLGDTLPPQLEVDLLRQRYQARLRGMRVLIIADDARDAEHVKPLLPLAGCALLITSRQHFVVPGMLPAATINLRTLLPAEAAQLLLAICDRIDTFAPKLAQLCGYLPLALRVSASLLAADESFTVERYIERLADERTRLAQLRDPDNANLDVEASLRLSYDALNGPSKAALCQLSVLTTSFDLDVALTIVSVGAEGEPLIRQLYRRSLIEWDAVAERYSLHDLVRALAAAELTAEQWAEAMQRYLPAVVRSYQASYARLQTTMDSLRIERLRAQLQASADELWRLLESNLMQETQPWVRIGMAPDAGALAMMRFAYILEALPRLKVDRQRTMRKLLLAVGQRGLIGEYRWAYSFEPLGLRRQIDRAAEPHVGDLLSESVKIVDTSHSPEETTVDRLDREQMLRILRNYWQMTLSAVDLQIVRLRWQSDPPRSFDDIANELGAGWTANSVLLRHHRIMQRTRSYLRDQGLLDDDTKR